MELMQFLHETTICVQPDHSEVHWFSLDRGDSLENGQKWMMTGWSRLLLLRFLLKNCKPPFFSAGAGAVENWMAPDPRAEILTKLIIYSLFKKHLFYFTLIF